MATLEGDRADDAQIVREAIFAWLRNPEPNISTPGWEKSAPQWDKMPRGLGDDYTSLDQGHANNRSFLSLTPIQFAIMEQFKSGNWLHSPSVGTQRLGEAGSAADTKTDTGLAVMPKFRHYPVTVPPLPTRKFAFHYVRLVMKLYR
jgi:hypothetical protein